MTTLLSNPTPLSTPLSTRFNCDRNQQPLSTTAIPQGLRRNIDHSMTSRQICLCCSTVLLRHIRLGGLYWRCHYCHEDMPVL